MDTVTILGYLAGALTTSSLIPQVIKIIKTKSVRDVSLIMFLIFSVGITLWIAYGIAINSAPIVIANTISLLLGLLVLWLKLRYNQR
jgi:MtN3 and saliva related transmembrane protein